MTHTIFSDANTFVLWLILFFGVSFLFTRHNKKHGKTAEYDERQQQIRLLSFRISYFILIVWSLIGMLLAENNLLFSDASTMFFLGILLSYTAFICITTWKNAVDPVLSGEAAEQKSKKLTMTIAAAVFWFFCVIWIIAEGVSYITGAVFYSLNKTKYMHSVFHFFVLAGSICHIIAVWDVLMEYL